MAGERLIKGYAVVNSNFVIVIIQKIEAMNADKKPDNMKGSNSNLKYDNTFSIEFAPLSVQFKFKIRHFKIICP